MYPGDRTPVYTRRADGAPTYARGKKWPAMFLLAVPFTAVLIPLLKAARKHVSWAACGLAVLVFWAVMLPAEHDSIMRGHWVYNERRILGPLFWGIPIEEPLIYYLMPPVFVITLFEYVAALRSGAIRLGRRTRAALHGAMGHVRARPGRSAFLGAATLCTAAAPFLTGPVGDLIGRAFTDRFTDKVLLRYRLTDGRAGVRCVNVGDQPVRRVTVEVTLTEPAPPGGVVVHVPRRAEAVLNPQGDASPATWAVKVERLFPRESSTDEEYISIAAPSRILRVQFVADEGRGEEEGASGGEAAGDALPPLPEAAE